MLRAIRFAALAVATAAFAFAGCSFRELDHLLEDAPDAASTRSPAPTTPPPDSELARLAKSLTPGSWARLSTINLTEDLFLGGASNILDTADSAIWSSATQQLMFVGGSHGAGSRTRHIVFDAVQNTWREEAPQSWFCSGETCSLGAYDHLTLDPARGEIFFRIVSAPTVRSYTIASKTWSTIAPMPTDGSCCGGLAYFPEGDGLVFVGAGLVLRWQRDTNAWIQVASGVAMGSYHNVAEYDPVHEIVLFGGGNDSRDFYKLEPSMRITKLADAPVSSWLPDTNVVVDPVSGDVLLVVRNPTPALHKLDVTSNVWTTLPAPPFEATPYLMGVTAPLPEHGVIMLLRLRPAEVWLYRHQ